MKLAGVFKVSVLLAITAALCAGCDEHAPLREGSNAQNTAITQAKIQEMSPAEAVYTGYMKMVRSNNAYPCVLTIAHTIEPQHGASGTASPAETVDVPKLTATLTFPQFSSIDPNDPAQLKQYTDALIKFHDLMDATGRLFSVQVNNGNYNANTHVITLPYTVANYQSGGNYGELSGELEGNHFKGRWYANPIGVAANFDLVKRR